MVEEKISAKSSKSVTLSAKIRTRPQKISEIEVEIGRAHV